MKSIKTLWQLASVKRKTNKEKQTKEIKNLIKQNPGWSELRVKEILMMESVKKQINRMRAK